MRKHDVSPHINRITLWSATCVTYTCSLARLAGRSGPEGFAGLRLAGAWLVRALALLGGWGSARVTVCSWCVSVSSVHHKDRLRSGKLPECSCSVLIPVAQ